MQGVSVSNPALENSIPVERGIALLQSRIVRQPASCKFVLAGFLKAHPRPQLDRLVFTLCKLQVGYFEVHLHSYNML